MQCININKKWAKGHIRLASAYIALGGHSNDACNALQHALRLDPGNPTARDLLVKELRRERSSPEVSASQQNQPEGGSTGPEPGSSGSHTQTSSMPPRNEASSRHRTSDVDDSISWADWIQFHWQRTQQWYTMQPETTRTFLKAFMLLILLYVSFGGRFGLQGSGVTPLSRRYESHETGENYYYNERHRREDETSSYSRSYSGARNEEYDSFGYQDYGNSFKSRDRFDSSDRQFYQDSRRRPSYNDDFYSSPYRRQNYRSSQGMFNVRNIFDGSITGMILLGGILYLGHRAGVNPMQAMIFLNMMNGGRRGFYGGGFGGGRGLYRRGYGGGFRRRRW